MSECCVVVINSSILTVILEAPPISHFSNIGHLSCQLSVVFFFSMRDIRQGICQIIVLKMYCLMCLSFPVSDPVLHSRISLDTDTKY